MICYYCGHKACAKIGGAKGNILKAMLGLGCWEKTEKYVCKECYKHRVKQSLDEKSKDIMTEMKAGHRELTEEIKSMEKM